MNKLDYQKIVKLEFTLMVPLIIVGIIMGLLIKNSYIYPFTFVSILLGSLFTLGMLKCLGYIECKNDIDEQQEEREFDDVLNKIHQPNRTSFHLSEFPQIIQDMVNGVYRDDVRIDPFRPRPKREK